MGCFTCVSFATGVRIFLFIRVQIWLPIPGTISSRPQGSRCSLLRRSPPYAGPGAILRHPSAPLGPHRLRLDSVQCLPGTWEGGGNPASAGRVRGRTVREIRADWYVHL